MNSVYTESWKSIIWIIKKQNAFLKKIDRQHSKYYNFYTGLKWGDAVNYDICFNSASYGIEESVEIIERMLNQHTNA